MQLRPKTIKVRNYNYYIMRKNINFQLSVFVLATLLASLTSCEDNKLARDMNGTWKGSFVTTYDDQSRENQDIYIKFDYVPSDTKDGGTYVEVRKGTINDVDVGVAKMNAGYCSYIKGEWEVLNGELEIKPDVSTLKVNINPDEVKVNYDNSWMTLENLYEEYGSSVYSRQEFISDMQKDVYKELFDEYKEDEDNADAASFQDLKVNGETMSFKTEDAGTITLHKTNENVVNIYNEVVSTGNAFNSRSDAASYNDYSDGSSGVDQSSSFDGTESDASSDDYDTESDNGMSSPDDMDGFEDDE